MSEGNGLALGIDIYTDGSDCTNGGLSAKASKAGMVSYAVGDGVPLDGYADPRELVQSPGRNAIFRLVQGRGGVILVADPTPEQVEAAGGDAGRLMGPMMGGNYGATSDSRFARATGIYGAIPIHDRYEGRELHDRLSD